MADEYGSDFMTIVDEDGTEFELAREHYPYCNCGAKMKGGAE